MSILIYLAISGSAGAVSRCRKPRNFKGPNPTLNMQAVFSVNIFSDIDFIPTSKFIVFTVITWKL